MSEAIPPKDPDRPVQYHRRRVPWYRRPIVLITGGLLVAMVGAFVATAMLMNIFERKQEARNPFFRVVEITDDIEDPALWGKNFPLQYDSYSRTVDQERTRYGGSEGLPRTPTEADPRSIVAQSRLEEDPRLKIVWAGYAFSHDFREERGHAYMLTDQEFTKRQDVVQQPGACLHCHASVYVPYKKAGNGDIMKGFEVLNQMPYQEAREHVTHPVACIDCHDADSMQLRITRPGFIEGIKALKEHEGVKDYDVNTMATHQEMRSFVCAQCHVEYYFKGAEKRLTYPWHNGLKGDEILAYYEQVGFSDWTHAETSAPVLKAQHPEFELWSQGTHAKAGVSCADCHMPYQRVGALKVSDHHVRSPLLNINNACQTCHKAPEAELRARVHTIQDRTHELRDMALDAVVELIGDIKAARAAGLAENMMTSAQLYQRRAQFLADFIEAENSMGFHAPQEAARILAKSIDYSRKGQRLLSGRAHADDDTTASLFNVHPRTPNMPSISGTPTATKWSIASASAE